MEKHDDIGKKRTISCGCFIVREFTPGLKEVLLVKPFPQRDNWGVPKGHIEEGETYVDCALREVREETGIRPQIVESVPYFTCVTRNHHEVKTVVIFLAKLGEYQDIVSDGENSDIEWFPLTALPTLHKYQQDALAAAIQRVMSEKI